MMKISNGIRNFGIRAIANFAFAVCAVFILSVVSAQAATFTVSNTNDSGGGSLREAITLSNASTGVLDNIYFGLSNLAKIAPLTPLPTITDPVIIDGNNGNVSQFPRIELSGENVSDNPTGTAIGLYIKAGGSTVRGLFINRFQEAGIRIDTLGGNTIVLNWIGTDTTGNSTTCGTRSCGNVNRGILIVGTTGNTIGGTNVSGSLFFDRNLISGNQGRGIEIAAGGAATIIGNYIGTDIDGNTDLGNTSHGIQIVNSSGSTVGGTIANARNLISGNNGSGITIQTDFGFTASNNTVQQNFIGVDANGNVDLGNNGSGVLVQASGNFIGGTTTSARNIISGNGANGISISTNFATGNTVTGNYIGVGNDGTTSIPNNDNGVQISNGAANNTIGGTNVTAGGCTGECNIIANNGDPNPMTTSAEAGVYVDSSGGTGNRIRRNSIFNNVGIGIDLHTSGSTANDANDPDLGANNQQNFPVITAADTNGNVTGTLNSTPNTTFAIDFYSNMAADAANSEGRTFIGSTTVITDGGGNAPFSFGTTVTLAAGQFITATATSTGGAAQAIGDTSEFSANQAVVLGMGGAAGFEADTSPRMNGDTNILSDDVVQIRRFFNGTDTPSTTPNEFQRADSAPIGTRGDGRILSDDVVQTRRYQNGTDAKQPAGGPTQPGGGMATLSTEVDKTIAESKSPEGNSREVRVESTSGNVGQTVTVNIRVNAAGEAEYGFILNYDSSVLSNPVVGAGNAGASVRSCNIATAGQLNCSVGGFPNNQMGSSDAGIGEIGAGNNQILITVTFRIAAKAQPGTTLLTLSNVNASSDAPQLFTPTATNGTVTIRHRRQRTY